MTNSVADEVIVLIIVLLLGLAMRWAFRSSRPRRASVMATPDSAELGLLEVISSGLTRSQAMGMRADLGEVGIRSSMSHRRDGKLDLLVFRDDVDRAKAQLELG